MENMHLDEKYLICPFAPSKQYRYHLARLIWEKRRKEEKKGETISRIIGRLALAELINFHIDTDAMLP